MMQNKLVRVAAIALALATAPTLGAAPTSGGSAISQIDLRDVTVGDAMRILSTQYGINVVASEKAAKIKTALYLRDVKPMEILDTLAKAYNLWYQKDPQSGIIRLFTVDEFRLGQVDAIPEQMDIFTLRYPNAIDVAYVIRNLFGDRVIMGLANNQQEVSQELQGRFQRFNIVDRQRSNIGGISGGGSSGGGASGSGSGGMAGMGGMGLGQNNAQNRIDKDDIEQAVGSAKRFTEDASTKGLVAGSEAEGKDSMGEVMRQLSPIYVTVIRAQNRVLVRCRDPEAMEQIRSLVNRLDVSQATLLMEVKVLSVDLSDGYHSSFDFDLNPGDFVLAGVPGAQPLAGAALVGRLVSDKFKARLQLLEKEGRVTELATPMLLTTNQEVSRVFVGEERPITTGYTSSSPTGIGVGVTTGFATPILVPITNTRPIGTTLLLTPNINADHTVNIRMVVEQSSLSPSKAEIPVPNTNILNSVPTAKVDVVLSRTFSGTVLGKDGVSIVVGGLIQDSAQDQQSKTPILGDIPVLGLLFKDDESQRSRKELIIIVKPHIQDTPNEAAADSQELLRNESAHPNARAMGGNLDIYRNPGRHHDDYRLQQRYKFYEMQDEFDGYHRRTRKPGEEPSMPPNAPPAFPSRSEDEGNATPQDYLALTRFAAQAVRQAETRKNPPAGINASDLVLPLPEPLFPDSRLQAEPLESWRKGSLYVTSVQVRNRNAKPLTVNINNARGQWLSSNLESPRLAGTGQAGDSTYLFLLSKEPFHEAVRH